MKHAAQPAHQPGQKLYDDDTVLAALRLVLIDGFEPKRVAANTDINLHTLRQWLGGYCRDRLLMQVEKERKDAIQAGRLTESGDRGRRHVVVRGEKGSVPRTKKPASGRNDRRHEGPRRVSAVDTAGASGRPASPEVPETPGEEMMYPVQAFKIPLERVRPTKYPWKQLTAVGLGFTVPSEKDGAVRSAAYHQSKKSDRKFTCRRASEGTNCIRTK